MPTIQASFFAVLLSLSTFACQGESSGSSQGPSVSSESSASADPSDRLPVSCRLEVRGPRIVDPSQPGTERFEVWVHNEGSQTVTLVRPGDGSESAMRTPVVGWSILPVGPANEHPEGIPRATGGRCGNQNALADGEVFDLAPGESVELGDWCQPWFYGIAPGRYRAVCYYQNDPSLPFSGLALGEHSAKELARLRASTPTPVLRSEEWLLELRSTEESDSH